MLDENKLLTVAFDENFRRRKFPAIQYGIHNARQNPISTKDQRERKRRQETGSGALADGACAHCAMESIIQWKPFWLAIQLNAQNDCARWQFRADNDVIAQAPSSTTTKCARAEQTAFGGHKVWSHSHSISSMTLTWYHAWSAGKRLCALGFVLLQGTQHGIQNIRPTVALSRIVMGSGNRATVLPVSFSGEDFLVECKDQSASQFSKRSCWV